MTLKNILDVIDPANHEGVALGEFDATNDFNNWLEWLGDGDKGYIPEGIYLIDTPELKTVNGSLSIIGEGTIRRKDNSVTGNHQNLLYLQSSTGGRIYVEGLTFDNNLSGQQNINEDNFNNFQHCASLQINARAQLGFTNAVVRNVVSIDPIGDGVVFAGKANEGTFDYIYAENILEETRSLMRSSLSITTSYDDLKISGFKGVRCKIEMSHFDTNLGHITNISNVDAEDFVVNFKKPIDPDLFPNYVNLYDYKVTNRFRVNKCNTLNIFHDTLNCESVEIDEGEHAFV